MRTSRLLLLGGGLAAGAGALWWLTRPSEPTEAELPEVPDPATPPPVEPVVISLDGEPTRSTATSLTSHLSDGFLRGVLALADRYQSQGAGIQAEDFLAVFLGESPWQGRNINPAAISVTGCVGINQICSLEGVGWKGTKDEYRALTAEQQLPYAARYFDRALGKRPPSVLRDVGDLYCLNFAPAYVGKSPETVIWHAGQKIGLPGKKHEPYAENRGLDSGGKGYIDVADMGKYMRRKVAGNSVFWRELTGRLNAVRAASSSQPATSGADPAPFPLLAGSTVFGGDSITVGTFPFVKVDGQKTRIAKGGQTSVWLLQQLRAPENQAALASAKNLVVLIGTNDVGGPRSAESILQTIEAIWQEGKKRGLAVYAMTLPPFRGWSTYTQAWEDKRQALNAGILASRTPDRTIRLDQLLASADDPLRLAKGYDSGDHLHPRGDAFGKLLSIELGRGPAPQGTAPAAADLEILAPEPWPVLATVAAPVDVGISPGIAALAIGGVGLAAWLILSKGK